MKKLLGLLAVGGLMLIAAPAQHAQATSLINPGISAPAAADAAASGVTEARWHWRRHHHRHWRWHRHWRRHHHW